MLLDKKISKNPAFPADMITQGGFFDIFNASKIIINLPIYVTKILFATNAQIEGVASKAPNVFYGWHQGGADNETKIEFLTTFISNDTQQWIVIAYS
ncbi:hypothetical protein JP30_09170 [Gallibacterium anatis IPDH697-78]|nr:hypothetical protein JP30_09170 [Gallibacterium anatis IPDH697-78]